MIALLPAHSILSAAVTCPPIPPAAPCELLLLPAPFQVGPGSYHEVVPASPWDAAVAALDDAIKTTRTLFASARRRWLALCKLNRRLASGPVLALPAVPDTTDRPGIHWNHPQFDQLTAAARRDLVPAAVKLLDRVIGFLSAEQANYEKLGEAFVAFDQIIRRVGRDECGFAARRFEKPAPDAPRTIPPLPTATSPVTVPVPTLPPKSQPYWNKPASEMDASSNQLRTAIFAKLLKDVCGLEPGILLGPSYPLGDYHYSLTHNLATRKDELRVIRQLPAGTQGVKQIHMTFGEGDTDKYRHWHSQAEEAYAQALARLQKQKTERLDQKDRRRKQRFEERRAR